MRLGLLLIDIQNDYFKGGNFELFKTEDAAENAKHLLTYFRNNNMPIFHIQHVNLNSDMGFFLPYTKGVDINKQVYPKINEYVIVKHFPDSFLQTNLKAALDSALITDLVVCGMMTHMCVDTTVRAATAFGYNVTLIEDACTTRDLEWNNETLPASTVHNVFMSSLNGTFATVKKTLEWINEQS